MFDNVPILSIVAYIPLVAAILLLVMRGANDSLIKKTATIVVLIDFIVSVPLWFAFDRDGEVFQFLESHAWIETLGVRYEFGIDGIALLLILLTTLLGVLAFLSSWSAIESRQREYYIFMLLLQTGMLGVFMSLDFFLFYVFWEVMLVPMYFLIGIWGGPRKLYAAIKFFLYTLAGSVVMLLGILALYFFNQDGLLGWEGLGGEATFSVLRFHEIGSQIPADLQFWVFLVFFISFAIKVPMFPFHTWLPDAHVEAPTAGSVILAGVLLKMGTYGFLRFSLPILPEGTREWLPWMVALSIVGIVYGALVAGIRWGSRPLQVPGRSWRAGAVARSSGEVWSRGTRLHPDRSPPSWRRGSPGPGSGRSGARRAWRTRGSRSGGLRASARPRSRSRGRR